MAKMYIKLWDSYESYFEPLSDAEVGRLVRAMMKYKSLGVEPEFNGNERFTWPAIKRELDEDAAYTKKKSDIGKLGGAPLENNNAEKRTSKNKLDIGLRTKDLGKGRLRLVMRRQRRNLSRTYFERISGSSVPQERRHWQNMLSVWVMNSCLP